MKHTIDWTTATINDGNLTVHIAQMPTRHTNHAMQGGWESIFNQIAVSIIPGVSYSMSTGWGQVRMSNGVITVQHVSDRIVDLMQGHLNAAVNATNVEFEGQQQERQRQEAAYREEKARATAQDQALTERFRQLGITKEQSR